MKKYNVRVIGSVLLKDRLVLYLEDGQSLEILQATGLVEGILDQITAPMLADGYADLAITNHNVFARYSQQTQGRVEFYRVRRKPLSRWLNRLRELVRGNDPTAVETALLEETRALLQDPAVQATSAREIGFDVKIADLGEDETVIAVSATGVVPHMDYLTRHMQYALKYASEAGIQQFLAKMEEAVLQWDYHAEELMRFMAVGDLPIADDGSIIAYKVLARGKDDRFYDPHSRRVPQRLGSYVYMDPQYIDLSRRTECSVGIHVAQRQYLRNYTSDVCFLIKFDPRDVVAVPLGEPEKVRIRGYHLVAELPEELYQLIRNNRPITDHPAGRQILEKIVKGEHISIMERVQVFGSNSAPPVVTPVEPPTPEQPKSTQTASIVRGKGKNSGLTALPQEGEIDPQAMVSPKEFQQQVNLTRKEQAQQLYRAWQQDPSPANWDALWAFKRKARQSWETLGVPEPVPLSSSTAAPRLTQAQTARALFDQQDFEGLWAFKRRVRKGWTVLGFTADEIDRIQAEEIQQNKL